ncbi:dihydroorotate dehydrogenase electron transfer subunit [Acidobacteriota bacterium]
MLKDANARIAHKESWGDYFLFSLVSPEMAPQAQPGQFIMVRTSQEHYPLLRRPFSIFNADKTHIDIYFQEVGIGTRLLGKMEPGDVLDIIGPLGKGFTIKEGNRGKSVALVGGGRGIAPLFFLAQRLRTQEIEPKLYYGGKSLADLPLKTRFNENTFSVSCSTEDGSYGFKGLITEVFESELNALNPVVIYACGPDAMLKGIAQIASKRNIPAELSLESHMGCGFGACWGCVKKIKKEDETSWTKICEEGPVLAADKIVWE